MFAPRTHIRSLNVRAVLPVAYPQTWVNLYGGHNSPDFTGDYLVIYWKGGRTMSAAARKTFSSSSPSFTSSSSSSPRLIYIKRVCPATGRSRSLMIHRDSELYVKPCIAWLSRSLPPPTGEISLFPAPRLVIIISDRTYLCAKARVIVRKTSDLRDLSPLSRVSRLPSATDHQSQDRSRSSKKLKYMEEKERKNCKIE